MEASHGTVEVTVRIAKEYKAQFDEVVRSLGHAGLTRVEPHPRFLMVSGAIAPGKAQDLAKLDGVSSVRVAQDFRAL